MHFILVTPLNETFTIIGKIYVSVLQSKRRWVIIITQICVCMYICVSLRSLWSWHHPHQLHWMWRPLCQMHTHKLNTLSVSLCISFDLGTTCVASITAFALLVSFLPFVSSFFIFEEESREWLDFWFSHFKLTVVIFILKYIFHTVSWFVLTWTPDRAHLRDLSQSPAAPCVTATLHLGVLTTQVASTAATRQCRKTGTHTLIWKKGRCINRQQHEFQSNGL